jgi:chromosome segregation ATPase
MGKVWQFAQAELQEELDELALKLAAESSAHEQVMGNLKAVEDAAAAVRKKCSDAEAMLEKKTLQVEAAKKAAAKAPAKKK